MRLPAGKSQTSPSSSTENETIQEEKGRSSLQNAVDTMAVPRRRKQKRPDPEKDHGR
jgi:hypothetical protein